MVVIYENALCTYAFRSTCHTKSSSVGDQRILSRKDLLPGELVDWTVRLKFLFSPSNDILINVGRANRAERSRSNRSSEFIAK